MKNGNQAEPFFFGELEGEEKKHFEKKAKEGGKEREDLAFLFQTREELAQNFIEDPAPPPEGGKCITAETLARFLEARLEKEDEEKVISHLNTCPACREEFVELAEIQNLPLESLPKKLKEIALSHESAEGETEQGDRIGEGKAVWRRVASKKLVPLGIAAALLLVLAPFVYKMLSPPATELLLNEPLNLRAPPSSQAWKEGVLSTDLGGETSPLRDLLNKIRTDLGPSPAKEAIEKKLRGKSLLLSLLNAMEIKTLLNGREAKGEDLLQILYVRIHTSPYSVFDFIKEEDFGNFICHLSLCRKEGGEEEEEKWEVILVFQEKG